MRRHFLWNTRLFALFFASWAVAGAASGATTIRFVKTGATGANNGTSWANAYANLQTALTTANSGDEIWVAAGTYKPTDTTDRSKSFSIPTSVAVYGGFAGTETLRTQRNTSGSTTILSGDIGNAGDASDNSYHVMVGGFHGTLDGFTITLGNANGNAPNDAGAGMTNVSQFAAFVNCNFIKNSSSSMGGAISNTGASMTLTNCKIGDNTSYTAGAIVNTGTSFALTNCSFDNNSATGLLLGVAGRGIGGALNHSTGTITLNNCSFTNNTATEEGGGFFNGGACTMNNCTFSGNTAVWGGGVANEASCTATNCTFSANSTAYDGAGFSSYSSSQLTTCTFTNNSGSGAYVNNSSDIVYQCVFTGNAGNNTSNRGGGIVINGSPKVTGCQFRNNSARYGGGLMIINGSPAISYCRFTGNLADQQGGGVNASGSPTLLDCAFYGNIVGNQTISGDGGGIWIDGSPTLTNCVLSDNSSVIGSGGGGAGLGGGLFISGSPKLMNCTIARNSADGGGGGICVSGTSSAPVATNCILWNDNSSLGQEVYFASGNPTFKYCDIRNSGGSGASWNPAIGTDGGQNVKSDPLFAKPNNPLGGDGLIKTADDGLFLRSSSPCQEAGIFTGAPTLDILDNHRINPPALGAYEGKAPVNAADSWATYP